MDRIDRIREGNGEKGNGEKGKRINDVKASGFNQIILCPSPFNVSPLPLICFHPVHPVHPV
jgi:hypothetical protein